MELLVLGRGFLVHRYEARSILADYVLRLIYKVVHLIAAFLNADTADRAPLTRHDFDSVHGSTSSPLLVVIFVFFKLGSVRLPLPFLLLINLTQGYLFIDFHCGMVVLHRTHVIGRVL